MAGSPDASETRIVIIGGGYAGAYFVQALERSLRRAGLAERVRVTLVDRHNFFAVYPLLVEAGTGSLEPRHAVIPIRSFMRTSVFKMAEVTGIDTDAGFVECRYNETGDVERLGYDHLVIALGSVTRMPDVPGLHEHGFELKSLNDAVAMRDNAIEMLEVADATPDPEKRRALLHFVVVGGNFTGVEVAGELDAFVPHAARHYRNIRRDDIRITLVERGNSILSVLGPELSDYAAKNLRRRSVDLRLKTTVVEVGADFAVLDNGERLATHTVLWCAGIAPTPLTLRLPVPRDDRGYIICDRACRVKGLPGVWAIGDCAFLPDPEGGHYPATAQHAVREAAFLADNLVRVLRGQEPADSAIRNVGSIAALGCRTGVAQIFGVKLSGFAAWWVWRTVYLLKTPGMARRVRVALDWTLGLLFRRDYVQLGVHRRRRESTGGAK